MSIYMQLQESLRALAEDKAILESTIAVSCKALSAVEAIGNTEHDDYPINKGKEVMVEADFCGAKGQAFTDHYGDGVFKVSDLITMELKTNRDRASFISAINVIWKYYGKVEKTVHCRDHEPLDCAAELPRYYDVTKKTLLIGLQPRFLEVLARNGEVRVLDLDKDNIGTVKSGIEIEDGGKFTEVVAWCEQIFATGSTLCNGTIEGILDCGKPVTFFGVTIAAAAEILGLQTYCFCGH